jgi:hypothetical protein
MAEIAMTKRPAMHAGEMGLFIDSPIFEDDFANVRTKVGLQVKVTQPHNLKQFRLAWVLAGTIAKSGVLGDTDKEEAMAYLLKKAKHVKYVYNKHREGEELEVVIKSIRWAQLEQDAFNRIFNRMIYIVVSEILPDMPEGELRAEVEKMAGVATPEPEAPKPRRRRAAPKPDHDPETGEVIESKIPATEPVTASLANSNSPAQPAPEGPPPRGAGTVSNPPAETAGVPAAPPPVANGKAEPPTPRNPEQWVAYTYDWLATAKDDPAQTDQSIMKRWKEELPLRNDCGVTSEVRTPVFDLYTEIIDNKRMVK